MNLSEIDDAIHGAKDRWNYDDGPASASVLALIRAAETMRTMLILPTIRVIQLGDFDDQMVINVIGPYDTEEDRDAALNRLQMLPGMKSYFDLSPSLIPAAAANQSLTAGAAANIRDANGLFEELSYT